MADDKAVGAPALDTNIESGNFDEKRAQAPAAAPPKKAPAEDEDEDEDEDEETTQSYSTFYSSKVKHIEEMLLELDAQPSEATPQVLPSL